MGLLHLLEGLFGTLFMAPRFLESLRALLVAGLQLFTGPCSMESLTPDMLGQHLSRFVGLTVSDDASLDFNRNTSRIRCSHPLKTKGMMLPNYLSNNTS